MKPSILSTAPLSFSLATAIAAMLSTQNIHATTFYYEGVDSQTWNSTASWTTNPAAANIGGARPLASDDVVFHMDGVNDSINMNLAGTQAALSLTYRSTGTLNVGPNSGAATGNKNLTIGLGGITKNAGSGALSFNGNTSGTVAVVVGANQTWTNNSTVGALNIGTNLLAGNAAAGTMGLGSNTLTLDGPGDFNFGAATTSNAVIGVSVGSTLIKNGTGTLTIGGDNAFSGVTQISGGTLSLATNGDINQSSGITINGSTAKLLQTSSTAIVPTVTLTQGALTGSGTVNTVNVGNATGGIVSNNNGVAGAALTVVDLTFAGAASVNTYNDTAAAAIVTTNLNTDAAGTVSVNPSIPPFVAGSYDLISYTTIGGAGAGQVVLGTITGATQRQNPVFGNSVTAFTLTVGADNPPYWSGEGDGNWNTGSINNWKFQSNNVATLYLNQDNVLFNDLATPAGPVTVNINAANVSPSSTTFEGTKDYVLNTSGAFGISTGSLTKNGTGVLTLSTANTYTGATAINGGTLSLGGGGTVGSLSPSSPITIATGTTFTVNQTDSVGQGSDFGLISGAGGLAQIGSGTTLLSLPNLFTGPTTVTNGTLRVVPGGRLNGGAYAGAIAISSVATFDYSATASQTLSGIISGQGSLVKGSSSTLTLAGANTYSGSTTVNSGVLFLDNVNALQNTSGITLGGSSAATLSTDRTGITISVPITTANTGVASTIAFATSVTGATGTITLNGAIGGNGDVIFSSPNVGASTGQPQFINLGASGTWAGSTTLTTGNSQVAPTLINTSGAPNVLPVTTVLNMTGGVGTGTGRALRFDLNGQNQELAGLQNTLAVDRDQRVQSTAPATLTINNSADYAFGGTVGTPTDDDGTAKFIGAISLTKTGTGKFTLVGIHDHTGNTTVNQGTLSLSAPNSGTSNDLSTVSIAGGAFLDLNFDESGGAVTDTVDKLFIGGVQKNAGVYKATGNVTDSGTSIAQITGPGTLTVTTGPAVGYTAWAATNAGEEGAQLDFDNDGVRNGVEYFMNSLAPVFTANPQLNASNTITWPNGGNIPASAYGTQFVVQTSSNLSTWTDVLIGDLTTNTNGPGGSLTYTLTGASPRFVRLKVSPN